MMTSIFKKMTVALALVGALGAASATPVLNPPPKYLGMLTPTTTLTFGEPDIQGWFSDLLSFDSSTVQKAKVLLNGQDGDSNLHGTLQIGVLTDSGDINWLASETLIAATDLDFSYAVDFSLLQPGNTYLIELIGNVSEGFFSVMVDPLAIPEPGSMALVLAGMGAVGVIARRRKDTVNKAGV